MRWKMTCLAWREYCIIALRSFNRALTERGKRGTGCCACTAIVCNNLSSSRRKRRSGLREYFLFPIITLEINLLLKEYKTKRCSI